VWHTPAKVPAMVRAFPALGAACPTISNSPWHYLDVMEAAVAEGRTLGRFTMVDLKVLESAALVASHAGVRSLEHWYGIPDAALKGSQSFPSAYNYRDAFRRFRYVGNLRAEAGMEPARGGRRSRLRHPQRLQARVVHRGRHPVEAQLRHPDDVDSRIPWRGGTAHGWQRRLGDRRDHPDSCTRTAAESGGSPNHVNRVATTLPPAR
jgi:hypothetical protein